MFYILTILVPAIIVFFVHTYYKTRDVKINSLKLFSISLIYIYVYTILIYILTGQYPEFFGWEYYSLLFFLIPLTAVVFIVKIFFFKK